ncbi:MAG: PCMD domain-containing protein [Muribaculaceae bacterium]|nr:PCMD domain-containing protein [Muribaculaceae bacterium]
MVRNKNIILKGIMAVSIVAALGSCAVEEPFNSDTEGQALVKMNLLVNSELTRADYNPAEDCRLYISNDKGVLFKWQGLQNIPSQGVYLRYGDYLAQAWAGDSIPASFDTKYYKGETNFTVSSNQIATQVTVVCKISNVVVSVDASDLGEEVVKTATVDVESSTGNLTFENATFSQKGYFMRNYNKETESYDDGLKYTLKLTDIDGKEVIKTGNIANILPAHEYCIVLKQDKAEENIGGAAIKIEIRDWEVEVDDEYIIHGKPEFSYENNNPTIDKQIYGKNGEFTDQTLFIGAYNDFKSVKITTEDETVKNSLGGYGEIDLLNSSDLVKNTLKEKGFTIEDGYTGRFRQFRIHLSSGWLSSLPDSETQYVLDVTAMDTRGMSNSMKIRIANNEKAMDAPFAIDEDYWKKNLLAIRAYSAELKINQYEAVNDVVVQYHAEGETGWKSISLGNKATESYTYKLTGLAQNTGYECRIVGGTLSGDVYQYESEPVSFKTEEVFEIPNASMENWWLNGKVWMPNQDSYNQYWDSGNHGSQTLSVTLTSQFKEFYHSNGSCAKLESKFVAVIGTLGKLGSGNIFIGKYAGTEGTNGKIDFGKEYNATHPSKVKVWVNYRPAKAVSGKGSDNKYIPAGEFDKGQIYIALSDQIKSVNTGNESTLVTEEKAPELFLAYGQQTFESDYGEDGQLLEVEIPFTYFDKAKTTPTKYLIIVCCASKYGDYFSGGDGSVMYVDDFELIYE